MGCLVLGCATPPAAAPPEPPHGDEPHAMPDHHHSFEDADRWAAIFDAPDRDAWQKPEEVIALLKVSPGQTAADVGAGTGYFLPHLAKAVGPTGRVIAVDTALPMVRHMNARIQGQKLTNVEAIAGAADDPRLPLSSVDRILIVDTWHHIDERIEYTKRLKQALTDGGVVLIVEFDKSSAKGPPAEIKLTPEEVKLELIRGGLAAEVITSETLPDQFVVRAWRG